MLNLETNWIKEDGPKVPNESEVLERIGADFKGFTFLSGGLANHNYDLGDGRILRVYKRSPQNPTIELESNLNDTLWQNFHTAKTLERGGDYLIQEKLFFYELEDSAEHGKVAGKSIGEIHSAKAALVAGHNEFLSSLFRTPSLSELIIEKLCWAVYSKDSLLEPYKDWLTSAIAGVVLENSGVINEATSDRVLLHGDCKPSNIKKCLRSEGAVVFDWEFSFVGPRLIDIGHFLRWGVSSEYLDMFIRHYCDATGVDLTGKLVAAKLIDVVNLSFQLAKSTAGSSRETDILNHLEAMVPALAQWNKPLLRSKKEPLAK